MQPNVNPETGIAYGYISARSLDPALVHSLMYEKVKTKAIKLRCLRRSSHGKRKAKI